MDWIDILKCPITGNSVRMLTEPELADLNSKIALGTVFQADGQLFGETVQKGLISAEGAYIYPIINGIILLLKDLAIVDSQEKVIRDTMSADKKLVQDFYNKRGWHTDAAGNYEDAVIFEDLREVSKDYLKKCHDRVSQYLNPTGDYMLDAASGALQYDDYLQYSTGYRYRVCVDLSFQALSEVKKKLGDKALCVLCDMTNMPFKDNVMNGFISLNTIYHIPKEEQAKAIRELFRVLAINGKGVVVYEWYKHSVWMNFWLLPFRGVLYTKNRIADVFRKISGSTSQHKMLYFHAHSYQYFKEHLPPFKVRVWRSVSVPFMKGYIHSWLFGKQILNWLYDKEEKEPEKCGLKGEYPLLVFEK